MVTVEKKETEGTVTRFHVTGSSVSTYEVEKALAKFCQGTSHFNVFYWQEMQVSVTGNAERVLVELDGANGVDADEFRDLLEAKLKELES